MMTLALDCVCTFAAAFADLPLTDAIYAFDHVLFGTADLDAGIRWFEERSSVRAAFGGSHPGRGTRNALASLGAGHYLEIMAPDPQQRIASDRLRELRTLASPKIIGWAVGSKDLAAIRSRAEAQGFKTIAGPPGSRQRPDGRVLKWETLGLVTSTPLVPFCIQWSADSPHPSTGAPGGCLLQSLRFETPQPEELRRCLHALAVTADIKQAPQPRIVAVLATPGGRVEID